MGHEEPEVRKPPSSADRLVSLDAYRGFVMLAMVSGGLGTAHLLKDPTWGWLADQLAHRDWVGCTFWDLIQPSFMFIVGVAMPFAFARRRERGDSWGRQFGHAVGRALMLVAIGIFLDSIRRQAPEVQFIRVLQQIAVGYLIAFLVLDRGPAVQGAAAALLLAGHTLAFLLYGRAMGVAAWEPKVNLGVAIDQAIHVRLTSWVNALHQALFQSDCAASVWPVSSGNYVTINALSSAATILLGVLCGELLQSNWSRRAKLGVLLLAGVGGLLLGWGLSFPVPMVKRIWTSSFGIYAAGWTILMIFAFYLVIDVLGRRRWAFPLVVVGMNSIAIYISAGVLNPVIRECLRPFVGPPLSWLPAAAPVVTAVLVVIVQWLFCYWLYRRRIFFRV